MGDLGWILQWGGCGFRYGGGFVMDFWDLGFVAVSLAGFCGRGGFWWWR